MRTIGIHTRVASFVGAVALLIQISPALATDKDRDKTAIDPSKSPSRNGRPRLLVSPPLPPPAPPPPPFFGLFEGFADDGLLGSFIAEVLWRQVERERARHWTRGHVRGRGRGPFVHGAHPGRVESGGPWPARRRHHGWVANRRAGAGRVSEVSRYCRDAQLRGRTREQKLFRGNHPRRARPKGLNVRPPRTPRGSSCCWVADGATQHRQHTSVDLDPANAGGCERDCAASLSW